MSRFEVNRGLWSHNIKIAMRVLKRNSLLSGINISGLVLGLISCMILLMYYFQESSYDTFFPDHDKIYRIATNSMDDGQYQESAKGPVPLLQLLQGQFPEDVLSSRIMPWLGYVRYQNNERYKESQFVFADSNALEIFPLEVIQGSLKDVLTAPFQVAISESKALQYFGSENPIGKILSYEEGSEEFTFNVVAVVADLPENTHLDIEFLSSFKSLEKIIPWYNNWFYPRTYVYVKIPDSNHLQDFRDLAQDILLKNGNPNYVEDQPELVLQSLTDIHLYSNRVGEWKANNTQINIHLYLILGIFVLLIAVINYVNLTTANSQQRTREVGIKKAMGSSRKQLAWQFLMESFLIILIAGLLSVGLLALIWGLLLSSWLQWPVIAEMLVNEKSVLMLMLGVILLSGLVGFYPTMMTVRFSPVDVIRSNMGKYFSKGMQRKVLVTTQFSMAMGMILLTLLLLRQYDYLKNKATGFNINYRVALQMVDDHDAQNYHILKENLAQLPFVENIAMSSTVIGLSGGFYGFNVGFPDRQELSNVEWFTLGVDEDYLKTFDIKVIEGRDFSRDFTTDEKEAFLLNQTAAEQLGGIAVGEAIEMTIYTGRAELRKGKVIGIVKDFHYQSLYESVKPLVIYINKHQHYTDYLNIELNASQSIVEQVKAIESIYQSFNPDKPMELLFLRDEIERTYHRELVGGQIMTWFTIMSIVIAALGAFGLATYMFRRRTKEIGVRKVLGASHRDVTIIMTREYVFLIAISCVISWPVVFHLSRMWLDNFAYAIQFGIGNYLLGLAILCSIVLLSNIQQIIWSIKLRPVDYLRDE